MTTSRAEQAVIDRISPQLFIAGRWGPGSAGATFPVEDPSTGTELAEVADAGPEDARAALDAAADAQTPMAAMAPRERADVLHGCFQLLQMHKDEFALLMTLEMGKPLAESRAEVDYAAEFFRWYSEEAVRIQGRYGVSPDGRGRLLTMSQPVGPCLFITPWNFPLAMGARKIAPAVAAGCTSIVKPAHQTPLSMLALAALLAEAGLPDGAVNVLPTTDPGAVTRPLLSDDRLRKLSFTGSTPVGRKLLAAAAGTVLRTSMELGGNAPFLVFEDADLDAAVEGALVAKMRNMGEACTAANRMYVHAAVAEPFTKALSERMEGFRVGRGTDPNVEVGPLIDAKARDKVSELVADARDRGADCVVGGEALEGPGHFFAPTVLAGVPVEARVMHEEIFGPIAPIATFETDEEALAAANSTQYGLVAYVYTSTLDRALAVVEGLEVGMVGLNTGKVSNAAAPFGGVKQSGIGREGGPEGLTEYLETKYVALTAGIAGSQ